MSTEVVAEKTSEGWLLQTADSARDVLAGPFADETEMCIAASELNLTIKPLRAFRVIGGLKPGTLFRSDGGWYRVIRREGRRIHVDVVGEDRVSTLPANTEITEISVLSRN